MTSHHSFRNSHLQKDGVPKRYHPSKLNKLLLLKTATLSTEDQDLERERILKIVHHGSRKRDHYDEAERLSKIVHYNSNYKKRRSRKTHIIKDPKIAAADTLESHLLRNEHSRRRIKNDVVMAKAIRNKLVKTKDLDMVYEMTDAPKDMNPVVKHTPKLSTFRNA
jgi:hypothetical protein